MLEYWNIGRRHYREGRRIAVQVVDPTALPRRERRRPLRHRHADACPSQSHGGTRSVASGHDEAWPSKSRYSVSPSFQQSNIPSFQ